MRQILSALIWLELFAVLCCAQQNKTPSAPGMNPGASLRIVKDSLVEVSNMYVVKGSIYNPNTLGVKNVLIKYYIWKKFMGNAWRILTLFAMLPSRISYLRLVHLQI